MSKKHMILIPTVALAGLLTARPIVAQEARAVATDPQQNATVQQQQGANSESFPDRPLIVGLWAVSLHSGGKVIDRAIYQWHSEHLVITNDDAAPQPPN